MRQLAAMPIQTRLGAPTQSSRPETIPTMKPLLSTVLLGAVLLTGCTRHYVITLNTGAHITTVGKPRLENGTYIFKDAKGQPVSVFAGSVREIAPASMSKKSENSQFIRSTSK